MRSSGCRGMRGRNLEEDLQMVWKFEASTVARGATWVGGSESVKCREARRTGIISDFYDSAHLSLGEGGIDHLMIVRIWSTVDTRYK